MRIKFFLELFLIALNPINPNDKDYSGLFPEKTPVFNYLFNPETEIELEISY